MPEVETGAPEVRPEPEPTPVSVETAPEWAPDPDTPQARHLLLLPPNLASLAKLAAKENPRFAVTGVRLVSTLRGYRAEATDCQSLAIVRGEMADAAEFPELPALRGAPNGAVESHIPASAWVEAFKLPPKRTYKPILANVGAVLGENETTFGGTDLERARSLSTRNVEGRWPKTDEVLPKDYPAPSVMVDAHKLAELLKVAAEFSPEGQGNVILEWHGAYRPMVVRCANATQEFTGILMPLS